MRRWKFAPPHGILAPGRVPLPVGRAGFKPVGGRPGVLGRFDSCLFRQSHDFAGDQRILVECVNGAKAMVAVGDHELAGALVPEQQER